MAIKAYFKSYGAEGTVDITEFEYMSWTGRWKTERIDNAVTVYVERRIMFAGIIPLWTEWVEEDNIIFRDVEIIINQC